MTTIFVLIVILAVLWFGISFFVINYDRKMQRSFYSDLNLKHKEEN